MPLNYINPSGYNAGFGGLRPYYYIVQLNQPITNDPTVDSFNNPIINPMVKLNHISMAYGIEGNTAQMQMWDPYSVILPSNEDGTANSVNFASFPIPQISDVVTIYLNEDPINTNVWRLVFNGVIETIHESITSEGKVWSIEAVSAIKLLNEHHVTFLANFYNDPLNPTPRFDASGTLAWGRRLTVAEIIREVMDYPDAFGETQPFQYSDIDWTQYDSTWSGGTPPSGTVNLEVDPRCGGFIPSTITFQDTPKGVAVDEVLQRAGNFKFFYDPQTRKIKVVEINLSCNRVGYLWNITFATPSPSGIAPAWAMNLQIKSDNTIWSSSRSANVVRITSAPMRLYSGNFIIPEMVDVPTGTNPNLVQVEQDTTAVQAARAVNLDNTFYRFHSANDLQKDYRDRQQYFVGMPMFPDWNIHDDYLPAVFEIGAVQLPPNQSGGVQPQDIYPTGYVGWAEFDSITLGHQSAYGNTRIGREDALHSYQAWYAKYGCPACSGQGLVTNLYTNYSNVTNTTINTGNYAQDNEPHIVLKAVGPSGVQRYVPYVDNYIFNPSRFGEPNPNLDNYGLTPFNTNGIISQYPTPWKNLCPVCRGVGMQPEWRIRHLEPVLCAGRNNAISASGTFYEVSIDPETTQTGPEQWTQTQTRYLISEGPLIQVEENLGGKYYLPKFDFRNFKFKDIAPLTEGTSYATNQKVNYFAHPLQLNWTKKNLINAPFAVTNWNDPDASLVPSGWTNRAPFTMIVPNPSIPYTIDADAGRVIFSNPLYIPCRGRFQSAYRIQASKYKIGANGLVESFVPNGGNDTVDDYTFGPTGYWRPARVFLQTFYTRQGWYDRLPNSDPVTVNSVTPEGNIAQYMAKAMVIDGRYALEVCKVNPSGYGPGASEILNTRLIQQCITDEQAKVEVHLEDFLNNPVPPSGEINPQGYEDYKRSVQGDFFPRGRLLKWEGTTPGEVQWEMAGYGNAEYLGSPKRPRVLSFRLVDDRPKLLMEAIRALEGANNLTVQGSLVLVGVGMPVNYGLGWVSYPTKGKAAVVRLTYDFTDGFTTVLELAREEARYGEIRPDDRNKVSNIERRVGDLQRIVEYLRNHQEAYHPGYSSGNDPGDPMIGQ